MILKVVDVKNPILREKAKKVSKIDRKILALISDMKETLQSQKDPEGVGLAAPQIGKSLCIFIVDYKKLQKVIINPEVLEIEDSVVKHKNDTDKKGKKRSKEILEGCLSLPHYYGPIVRPGKIKIKYLDEKGQEKIEEFSDFDAQIMQHEIDHLNGRLFVDKILEQKAPLYKFDGDEWEEVEIL